MRATNNKGYGVAKEWKEAGVDLSTFYRDTKATFAQCKVPDRQPDFVSESGSHYWFFEYRDVDFYVVRWSDHWCDRLLPDGNKVIKDIARIASCVWHIRMTDVKIDLNKAIAGQCCLRDFRRISWHKKGRYTLC